MRKHIIYTLCALLLAAIATACGDDLDVQRDYGFTVEHLPVPKRLVRGETAEIRCQLVREGRWDDATYQMRYFQPDGKGELRYDDGTLFLPNDLYDIERETFRIYYTSRSEDSQTIDLYFIDNFGNMCTLNFSFNNENKDDAELLRPIKQ